jgi:hypothetical protein
MSYSNNLTPIFINWSNESNIKTGDILYCHYPYTVAENSLYHPHYVLVGDVWIIATTKETAVTVFYGTSKKTDKIYKYELLISKTTTINFNLTGLTDPTKFDLSKKMDFVYDKKNFLTKAPKTTPRVGSINFTNENIITERIREIKMQLQQDGLE